MGYVKNRIIAEVPPITKKLKIIIDSDAANEIDDLYAITLALCYPERFDIIGFVATHFAQWAGPESIKASYDVILELLNKAGLAGKYPVKMGSSPMQYPNVPNDSEGVDFIIESARSCSSEDPLWVVGIGAATNLACALLKAPDIAAKARYVFHARSEHTWPDRSVQFNVYGDIIAAKTLLESDIPLIWFDTGTYICAPYEDTRKYLAPTGEVGKFLHEYRDRNPYFALPDKGFFDMGDFAFLLNPGICESEICEAPELTRYMEFKHTGRYGRMQRVYEIAPLKVWELLYEGITKLNK
ncbi:MAG: nucleoside hydrolase [Oscillospiraceae bacterium]|nr:nucleoside hydrolase [Oscillospiraceae bacterium]